MTVLVIGRVADALGHCMWAGEQRVAVVPSSGYRTSQSGDIPLDLEHDEIIGRVAHLERDVDGALWAVAVSDLDGLATIDTPMFLSPHVDHYGGHDAELRAVAITGSPATIAAPAITVLPGELDPATVLGLPALSTLRQLVERAAATDRARRFDRRQPLTIAQPLEQRWAAPVQALGPIEWSAPHHGAVLSVR